MVPYFPFLEAAYMAKMCGSKAEELFDRIAGLPAVFAFDVADGWRCELCVDSVAGDSFNKIISHRQGDNWSEEFPNTSICNIVTDGYYIRIFKNSEYKFAVSLFESSNEYWYAANTSLTAIGDKMKTIEKKHSNFSVLSVSQNNSNVLRPPYISIGITEKTTITDSSGEIISETTADTHASIGYGYICKGDMDMNAYAEYVLATRKFSDEFNGISSTT